MKSVIVTLGAFAGLAAAQNFLGLPECGQVCAGSMWGPAKAQELGCSPGDVACLCKNQNFIFGLRDCSSATCGGSEARQVVEFGIKACSDAGVQITDGSNTASGVSTIVSTLTSGQSTITTAVSTSTASSASGVSTESDGAVVSTVSNSESTFVTTLSTVTSSAEEASTTATETATETESATATESQTEGQTESGTATGTDGAAATTTTEGAAMPMRTLAPGAILGAGLAALLL